MLCKGVCKGVFGHRRLGLAMMMQVLESSKDQPYDALSAEIRQVPDDTVCRKKPQ